MLRLQSRQQLAPFTSIEQVSFDRSAKIFTEFWRMAGQLFDTADEKFSFEAFGVVLMCQRVNIKNQVVYHVTFSSKRKPIVIARAKFVDSDAKWTSIPEGRQKEAEGVGELIEKFLSKKS